MRDVDISFRHDITRLIGDIDLAISALQADRIIMSLKTESPPVKRYALLKAKLFDCMDICDILEAKGIDYDQETDYGKLLTLLP